ncbi:rhomboid family membrane protein [Ophiocordyceps camponoti-floridani]|uniref:Rhomboid family membrane protein n=1 Tax=Ophiocordyceps camponoti-floridani TaxID=2030778 RepID=A0A8H4Q4T2_9HYPO|nr:rhomboid family membrane protein [Ophiocordyceps camponoti-floridani]
MSTPQSPQKAFLHNAAIGGVILAPFAMLLPPRRLDIRFAVLFGTFSLAANHLAYEHTGETLFGRIGRRVAAAGELPEGAKRTQQLLRREADGKSDEKPGLVKRVWMGGEGEDWKARRAEEHRRSLEEGKGLGDIIMEQVADVLHGTWRPDSNKNEAGTQPGDHGGK